MTHRNAFFQVRGHLRTVRDDECPPAVQRLLEDCINTEVSQRPDAAEIVERLQAIVPAGSSRSLAASSADAGALFPPGVPDPSI